jgi:hypothetical protein
VQSDELKEWLAIKREAKRLNERLEELKPIAASLEKCLAMQLMSQGFEDVTIDGEKVYIKPDEIYYYLQEDKPAVIEWLRSIGRDGIFQLACHPMTFSGEMHSIAEAGIEIPPCVKKSDVKAKLKVRLRQWS